MTLTRISRRLITLLMAAAFFIAPAAADNYPLKASSAQTAAGQGTLTPIGNWRVLLVQVNVTAGSGTVTTFRVWIEGTPDDGVNWYELPCDVVLKAGAAAPGAALTNQRDIVNESALVTSQKYVAICETWGSQIRAAWNIAGTTPSETFTVTASGK